MHRKLGLPHKVIRAATEQEKDLRLVLPTHGLALHYGSSSMGALGTGHPEAMWPGFRQEKEQNLRHIQELKAGMSPAHGFGKRQVCPGLLR